MRKRSWIRTYWENFLIGIGIILILVVICPILGAG